MSIFHDYSVLQICQRLQSNRTSCNYRTTVSLINRNGRDNYVAIIVIYKYMCFHLNFFSINVNFKNYGSKYYELDFCFPSFLSTIGPSHRPFTIVVYGSLLYYDLFQTTAELDPRIPFVRPKPEPHYNTDFEKILLILYQIIHNGRTHSRIIVFLMMVA